MRIKIKLDEHIDVINNSMQHTIIGTYTDENDILHNETLLTNDTFKEYLNDLFFNREFILRLSSGDVQTDLVASFNRKWNIYVTENQHNFNRIAEALYTEYNPLYNYNKLQHTVNIRSGSQTDSGSFDKGAETDTLTKSGEDKLTKVYGATEKNTTNTGSITDTHNIGAKSTTSNVATMDTNTFQPTGKVDEALATDSDVRTYANHNVKEAEVSKTDTDTRSFTNYSEGTTSGARHDSNSQTLTFNNVKDEFTDETKGNIGVMESVTMIESELRLRKRQIGLELLLTFMNMWTYAL